MNFQFKFIQDFNFGWPVASSTDIKTVYWFLLFTVFWPFVLLFRCNWLWHRGFPGLTLFFCLVFIRLSVWGEQEIEVGKWDQLSVHFIENFAFLCPISYRNLFQFPFTHKWPNQVALSNCWTILVIYCGIPIFIHGDPLVNFLTYTLMLHRHLNHQFVPWNFHCLQIVRFYYVLVNTNSHPGLQHRCCIVYLIGNLVLAIASTLQVSNLVELWL